MRAAMNEFGSLADKGRECLRADDDLVAQRQALAVLIASNFSLRRSIYGDDVVGERNLAAIELATSLGFAAKFTGSGGALVMLPASGSGWYICVAIAYRSLICDASC